MILSLSSMPVFNALISKSQNKVDIEEACKRIPTGIGIQGNVDPGILFGNKESIKERIDNTFNKIKDRKYILNLGHGILPGTPEENAQTFFDHGKKLSY